jgi:prepilin-type N-terminal cleavage/methylation domain-containing protein
MKNIMKRGFTLIELLVVIAIIGILAAVVLGSLNDARDGANDASAKTSINNIRNVSEVFYSENGFTYGTTDNALVAAADTVTTPTAVDHVCLDPGVINLIEAAGAQTREAALCVSDDDSYGVSIGLRSPLTSFCVDSTGFSGEVLTADVQLDSGGDVTTCN